MVAIAISNMLHSRKQ